MPFFTTGPRKPATFKQRVARIVNWGLFTIEGANSNIGKIRYNLDVLRSDSRNTLTELQRYRLLNITHSLKDAELSLEDARALLREINKEGKKS